MIDKTAREKAIVAYEQHRQEKILKATDKFKTLFNEFLDDTVSFTVEEFWGYSVAKISSVPELVFLGDIVYAHELGAKLTDSFNNSRWIAIKSWSDVGWCLAHLDEMLDDEDD